jgi:hypothetical protein
LPHCNPEAPEDMTKKLRSSTIDYTHLETPILIYLCTDNYRRWIEKAKEAHQNPGLALSAFLMRGPGVSRGPGSSGGIKPKSIRQQP